MIPFPDKKYSVIYADPPWDYGSRWWRKGSDGKVWKQSVIDQYKTMSFKDLQALPILDIAENDCMLFMWVISSMLDKGIELGLSWGFKYSTVGFVWHKDAQPVLGTYTHSECELCLIFKRGKIPQPRGSRKITQFLKVKRGKHSEKPYQVRDMISEMFPHHDKIELFARPNWTDYDRGWDFWGNEVS